MMNEHRNEKDVRLSHIPLESLKALRERLNSSISMLEDATNLFDESAKLLVEGIEKIREKHKSFF